MKRNILIALLVLAAHFSMAQSLQERYLNAKELFRSGKYGLAREAFQPLTIESSQNPFAEYASFFFALSSYHEGYKAYARDMLLQVKSKYPEWDKIDEVNYWLAKIYFEENQYDKGLEVLSHIRDEAVKADANAMKRHFVSGIQSTDSLELLLNLNSSDTLLAQLTAERIARQSLARRDLNKLTRLVEKYDLDKARYEVVRPEKTIKKDQYKVAVLLPFMQREYSSSPPSQKNFVYELYEGLKLACNELNRKGHNIQLFAYDTRKDSVYTRNLLAREEMKGMDMIIGPLSSETINSVSAFSYRNQINMVNPVSSNAQIISYNPFSFLFLSSLETQAAEAAEFAARAFDKEKDALIYFGHSQKDSTLAVTYRAAIEEAGFKVRQMKRFRKGTAKEVFNLLNDVYEEPDEDADPEAPVKTGYIIPKDSVGHIFVASDSDDGMLVANLISGIETRGEQIPVLGSEDWLDYNFVIPEQLERLQVHMVAPSFIDYASANYQEFRQMYLAETNSLPGKFAAIGYDMMLFFGDLLQQYGVYYQLKFEEIGFKKGFLLPGYQYDGAQDNQYAPIVVFEESELKIVNKP